MTFKHSGKYGDIIASLPTIQAMGGGILYLPENGPESIGIFSGMYQLLKAQSYIHDVVKSADILKYGEGAEPVDIDLDLHRTHPQRGKVNIVQRYFDVFGINESVPHRWLTCSKWHGDYSLINVTQRFREGSRVSWRHIMKQMVQPCYFTGTDEEYGIFVRKYGQIERAVTHDVLGLAIWVNSAREIWCNQSLVMILAAALGKTRHVEFKPGKTNCRFYTQNEYCL